MKTLIQTHKWDVKNDGDIDQKITIASILTSIFYFDVHVPN
jgi:hypothetical protein